MHNKFRAWWFAIPVLTTLNQSCIKLLALALGSEDLSLNWILRGFAQPYTYAIILCEIASFVLWMRILTEVEVSKAVPLTALSYVLILCVSWFIFHEPIFLLQIIGGAFILIGVWFIGTASTYKK